MTKTVLEMREITKDFPGIRALDRVSLTANQGEILALVGENGAGKSTLMKILSGVYPWGTYSGQILLEGKTVQFSSTKDAVAAGIAIIHQELNLVPGLSVAENLWLGREPRRGPGLISWAEMLARSRRFLALVELEVDPRTPVKNLSVGRQQMVEIARALSYEPKILVMDEPTSALSQGEVERLFKIIRSLKQKGVTVIYISHRLEEIFEIADRVAVLRDGLAVGTLPIADCTREKLVAMMVGRDIRQMYPKEETHPGRVVLEVRDFSAQDPDDPEKWRLKDISFSLRSGEIVGMAGLMGAGRSELAAALFGAWAGKKQGLVKVDGQTVRVDSPWEAIRHGLALVTEDRKATGLVLGMSVLHNLTLSRLGTLFPLGIIRKEQEETVARHYVEDLRIKAASLNVPVNTLSGGNQQKVLLGRWLATKPKVLILDEPTRGVDVGAKVEIYKIMNQLARQGVAILMISSDLPEVLAMSDRILVMHEGRLVADLPAAEATQQRVMNYATGGK